MAEIKNGTGAPAEKQNRDGDGVSQVDKSLTALGITDLLRSEFAGKSTEDPDRKKVERSEESEVTKTEEEVAEERRQLEEDAEAAGKTVEELEEERRVEAEAAANEGKTEEELEEERRQAAETEEEEEIDGLPDDVKKRVSKRIGKIVAERERHKTKAEEMEARAVTAEQELEEARAGSPTQPAANGLPRSPQELDKLERNLEQFVDGAEAYLDDAANEETRTKVEDYMGKNGMDKAGLKAHVREVKKVLDRQLPAHRQSLAQFQAAERQTEPAVKKFFPWMDKKGTPEYATAQSILKLVPELAQRSPAHRLAMGIYVLGVKEFDRLQAAAKKNGKPAAGKTPPPKPPKLGGGTPETRGRKSAAETAAENLAKNPTAANVTELLRTQL